ncbi:hypothetical protein ACFQ7J_04740 [Streptomyces sp. NPDC056501]|uniref:hypothetical protein n=1 Tax=Streptomyces sp. NPDC056501 TaxID=3345841 RepID=UPI0036B83ACB
MLMAGATAVALGVVPTILEQWTSQVWIFGLVFLAGLATVLMGWLIRRPKGLGVVLSLYSPERTQRSRVGVFKAASRSAHTNTLVIDRSILWPAGQGERVPASVVDVAARLIDAQVEELRETNRDESDVVLYPLAHLSDGFLLGRRLSDDPQLSLSLMHLSRRRGRSVVLGIQLDSELRGPVSPRQQSLISAHLADAANPVPHLVEVAATPGQAPHRIALIVRLAPLDSMVTEALQVVTTGRHAPDSQRVGYQLMGSGGEPDVDGFGAYLVIEIGALGLPDDPEVFVAVTMHINRAWRAARQEWATRTGTAAPVEGRLFFHGPLPIAMALGWVWSREPIDIVHHSAFELPLR